MTQESERHDNPVAPSTNVPYVREKKLVVSPKLLLDFLKGRYVYSQPPIPPLPEDAEIVRCGYDLQSDALTLIIRSGTFDAVPANDDNVIRASEPLHKRIG